jgi:hypothetical protein
MRQWRGALLAVVSLAACSAELDPAPAIIHARFDPDAKVIPMPTNILRDDVVGRLDLPADDPELTPVERELYEYLETLDGWSSASQATVEFTGAVAPESIDPDTIEIWEWGVVPRRVIDATLRLDRAETRLAIDAPRAGWARGKTYVVIVRGGPGGVRGAAGEKVECDAAFYFLRLATALDDPAHVNAFPGATRAEKEENARALEEVRRELLPYFDFVEERGLGRGDVAALWAFTVTQRSELATDKASQRMPLPIDLLLDPATGHADLPAAPWDSATVVAAKARLAERDGFGTSMNLSFEFTGPLDPASVTDQTIELYDVSSTPPRRLGSRARLHEDRLHVLVTPEASPLTERTRYALVVRHGLRDAEGSEPILMPLGKLLGASSPVLLDGASQLDAVDDADAVRVEDSRAKVAALLDQLGRDRVLAAWPFTTMSIVGPLRDAAAAAETLGTRVDPIVERTQSAFQAAQEFPLASLSLWRVGEVVHGTIASPVYLDPVTRGRRADGGHTVEEIHFTMTIPADADPSRPLPVVVFGHGLMTERRFVLALADALAQRGFAAISIDFPYHGLRTHCAWSGPTCIPDPLTGDLHCPDPCESGTTCAPDGRCVDAAGQGNHLRNWPILSYPQASGAAFIEVEEIANSADHFRQAVTDLGALSRSLRQGNWRAAIGYDLEPRLHYAGQSLGGIVGATYLAFAPDVGRAVLNVPGADTVDMFRESLVFGGHVTAFFTREGIQPGSFEEERFFNVARWFMDATDPQNVARLMPEGRQVMLQMATLDVVIPNPFTRLLEDLSGVPRRDYIAEHAFITIPVEPEYLRGVSDLARFLEGTLTP